MFIVKHLRRYLTLFGLAVAIIALPMFSGAQVEPSSQNVIQSAVFETAVVEVSDLSGILVGEGEHSGEEHCIDENCNRKTRLVLSDASGGFVTIEYRFQTRLAFDAQAGFVIASGTGTLSSGNQKDRFQFSASIEDNNDGSLRVTYNASRPDASFIITSAPGTFEITTRP